MVRLNEITEEEWLGQVVQLAETFGFAWVHFRPGRTQRGWRTPVSGPLGKGWPDLTLVKGERIIFAELKREGMKATPEQMAVLGALGRVAEVYIWHPSDFEAVAALLATTSGRQPA